MYSCSFLENIQESVRVCFLVGKKLVVNYLANQTAIILISLPRIRIVY